MLCKLADLCMTITKGTTPSTVGFSFTDTGVNFVKSEQLITQRKLNYTNKYFISADAHRTLKRSQLNENDILMSIAGAYLGKLAIVSKTDLPANTNQAVGIIRCNTNLIKPEYLFYYLSTDKMRIVINSFNAQSAQPNINLTQIGELQINLPDMSIQRHIVNTISSLLLKSL